MKESSVSAFDTLRQRTMMRDLWISAEQPVVSRREITRRKINRIFKGMLERIGWKPHANVVKHLGPRVEITRTK